MDVYEEKYTSPYKKKAHTIYKFTIFTVCACAVLYFKRDIYNFIDWFIYLLHIFILFHYLFFIIYTPHYLSMLIWLFFKKHFQINLFCTRFFTQFRFHTINFTHDIFIFTCSILLWRFFFVFWFFLHDVYFPVIFSNIIHLFCGIKKTTTHNSCIFTWFFLHVTRLCSRDSFIITCSKLFFIA